MSDIERDREFRISNRVTFLKNSPPPAAQYEKLTGQRIIDSANEIIQLIDQKECHVDFFTNWYNFS